MGSYGLASAPASAPGTARRRGGWATSATAWLERESLLVVLLGVYSAGLLLRLSRALASDSWLTLVYGREFWQHGLPRTGDLTLWTHGVSWVDQQWLAQAFFGGLAAAGGVSLALLAHAVLLIAALAVALASSRRFGGSVRSVALVTLFALPALLLDWVLRAQSLAYVLFALLVSLLVADSKRSSRRVYIALPMLVVWANVHGSVLLGAALVALRGVTLLRTERRRALALVTLPWLCAVASPYGPLGLLQYYRSLLLNPLLSALVPEWARTTPSLLTGGFYLLAFLGVWLFGRCRRDVRAFEALALLFLLADGLLAVRNMVWSCLAAVIILPRLLDQARSSRQPDEAPRLIRLGLPLAACAAALIALPVAVDRTRSHDADYPSAAAAAVAHAAARDASLRVFADTKYADWLIWQQPSLRGRVVYDARFELLRRRQLVNLYLWSSHIGKHWENIPGCRALIVLNRRAEPLTERALLATGHATRIFRDAAVAVLVSRQPSPACETK
jgi:hypothetical protein